MPPKRSPGRPPIRHLTPTQRNTLREIKDFVVKCQYPPTLQDLSSLLKISTASVHEQLDQLIRKGYLEREAGKARGLRIVREFEEIPSDLASIPLLGVVAAGSPLLAEENVLGEVLVEAALLKSGRCFALRVNGDSMVGAGIIDGGIVIVRQMPMAENGDIVVALVDGEATVKRLSFLDGVVELRPENRRFRPIAIGPEIDFRIVGKVVGIRRSQVSLRDRSFGQAPD